jgi:adenylate kinase
MMSRFNNVSELHLVRRRDEMFKNSKQTTNNLLKKASDLGIIEIIGEVGKTTIVKKTKGYRHARQSNLNKKYGN